MLRRPCLATVNQLVIRDAAPQEERQPRGEIEIGDAVRLTGRDARRFLLGTHEEIGTREQTTQRQLNPFVEGSIGAPLLVEVDQRADLRLRDGAAIRATCDAAENLASTDLFLRRGRWTTGEHLAAALRVLGALRVERARDAQEADRRVVLELRDAVVLERLPIVLLDHVEAGPEVRRQERGADCPRARLDRHRDFEDAVALIPRHPLAQTDTLVLEQVRALAVDDQLELLARNEAANAKVLNGELVLAIGREIVARHHAAARSER